MKCNICGSDNIKFINELKPYSDLDWTFNIYDCRDCLARFTLRDKNKNYFDELYGKYAHYQSYFEISDIIKRMIDKNQLGLCGLYLKQWPSYRAAIQFVEENDINKNKKILEIGCSTGFLSAYLRARGYDVYGIDVSEKAIKKACEKFGPYYSTSMPDDKIFDLVFSCGTIGCVDQPYNFLDKVLSRLSDKGIIFCNAPNKNSMLVDQLWLSTPPPDMISIFAPKTFGIFAEKRGLNLIYKEDKNKILATITYPIQFSSLSATDFLTRMKYIHPLVTITINTLKNSIRWLLNKFQPSQSLSQYGLFIYLYKK